MPESPVYNTPSAFHLRGNVRIQALEAAFLLVIQRHENFRTTFALEEGELVQRVSSSSAFRLEHESFLSLPAGDRKKAVHDCLEAAAALPFELSAAPPFRALLVSIDHDEHVLLFVSHHIISDGWSRSNLYRELSIAYTALAANTSVDLPELPVQFADYSAWQRRWAKSAAFEEQAAYWKAQLAGELEPLNLPRDGDRSAADLACGDECSLEIGPELVAALKARARERGATLFMILLAAFKILLHRYTAQTDIIVGVPIANRRHPKVEGLIGPFVNTLALRTAVSSAKTFEELLEDVKETALQAYEHQDMPFEVLVRILQVERDSDRTPVFQTSFVLQDFPEVDLQLDGLKSTPFPVSTHTSKFDLSLEVRPTPSSWRATMQFNTGLFSPGRARQMLDHWHAVLRDVALHPDRRVSEISLLSPNEKQQMLVEWNRTERKFPKNTCLHQLFEKQVEQTPKAVALVFGNQELTYQELDARANQLGPGASRSEHVTLDREAGDLRRRSLVDGIAAAVLLHRRSGIAQSVRSDRSVGRSSFLGLPARQLVRYRAFGPTDREHAALYTGSAFSTGAGGSGRRIASRWRGAGARIP
jgi:NRPS condensation-like uncharacterized protein